MLRETILTKKDLVEETFQAGGKGGQHQNKTSSGVRLRHPESGAVGEARDSRSQEQNRRAAFRRMVKTPEFQVWLEFRTKPFNFKVEVREAGEWVPARSN